MVNDIELNADQLRLSVHPGFALDVMRRFVKPVVSSMLVVTKDLSELGLLGKSTSTAITVGWAQHPFQ